MGKGPKRFSPVLTDKRNPRTGQIAAGMKRSKKGQWVHVDSAKVKIENLEARIKELEKGIKEHRDYVPDYGDVERPKANDNLYKLLKGGE